jgi:hypothetical protein
MADQFDEDADVRSHLQRWGRPRSLNCVASSRLPTVSRSFERLRGGPPWPTSPRWSRWPTDEVVRLRLFRAIRDLGV